MEGRMIEVKNVTKYYGNFLAIDHINFKVDSGEIVAFLGPNGAGKTTTMRIITGYMPPNEGDVLIDGIDIFENPEEVKAMIGYLPENPPLYPELTVSEFLSFTAELKKVPKDKIKKQVERSIELADLGNRKNTLIRFLSKGLKQRVGIAQSIVNSPKVLVLDEPTVGLDPIQVVDVRKLIKRLSEEEKRTIILSTHILAEASEICQKAVIINNGKIAAVDSIEKLRSGHFAEMKINLTAARESARLIPLIE
jgi:ABC-2 type transport system ATP-binding protein